MGRVEMSHGSHSNMGTLTRTNNVPNGGSNMPDIAVNNISCKLSVVFDRAAVRCCPTHHNFHLQHHLYGSELQISVVLLTSIDSTCVISSPKPMFDHLLESSRRDDSNKWSNIGFGEEIGILGNEKRSLSGALLLL